MKQVSEDKKAILRELIRKAREADGYCQWIHCDVNEDAYDDPPGRLDAEREKARSESSAAKAALEAFIDAM